MDKKVKEYLEQFKDCDPRVLLLINEVAQKVEDLAKPQWVGGSNTTPLVGGCQYLVKNNKKGVDWEGVRIKAAIAAMQGMISNSKYYCTSDNYGNTRKDNRDYCAREAIRYADSLIEELKKNQHD